MGQDVPKGAKVERQKVSFNNRLGFITLAFDASYNGESGRGQPHFISSPDVFVEDFSAAVDFLGTNALVNRDSRKNRQQSTENFTTTIARLAGNIRARQQHCLLRVRHP